MLLADKREFEYESCKVHQYFLKYSRKRLGWLGISTQIEPEATKKEFLD